MRIFSLFGRLRMITSIFLRCSGSNVLLSSLSKKVAAPGVFFIADHWLCVKGLSFEMCCWMWAAAISNDDAVVCVLFDCWWVLLLLDGWFLWLAYWLFFICIHCSLLLVLFIVSFSWALKCVCAMVFLLCKYVLSLNDTPLPKIKKSDEITIYTFIMCT